MRIAENDRIAENTPSGNFNYIVLLYIDPETSWGEEDLSIRYPAVSGRVGNNTATMDQETFSEDYAWQEMMSALSASGLASVQFSPKSGDFSYNIGDSGARNEWRGHLKKSGVFQDSFQFSHMEDQQENPFVSLYFVNEHPSFQTETQAFLASTFFDSPNTHAVTIRFNDAPVQEIEVEQLAYTEKLPALFPVDSFDPESAMFGSGAWETADDAYRRSDEYEATPLYVMDTLPERESDISHGLPIETPEIVLEEYYELQGSDTGELPRDAVSQMAVIEQMQESGSQEDPGMKTLVIPDPFWAPMADHVRGNAKYQRVNESPMRIRRIEGDYDHYVYTSGRGDVMHLYLEIFCTQSA